MSMMQLEYRRDFENSICFGQGQVEMVTVSVRPEVDLYNASLHSELTPRLNETLVLFARNGKPYTYLRDLYQTC